MFQLLPATLARFEFRLEIQTPSINQIRGMHFQVYRKLRMHFRAQVLAALENTGQAIPPEPLNQVGLYVERGTAGTLDWDNAYGGLKPLFDCLVMSTQRNPDGLGLIMDDSPAHMPEPPYLRQVSAKRGKGFTLVRVFDLARPEVASFLADLSEKPRVS